MRERRIGAGAGATASEESPPVRSWIQAGVYAAVALLAFYAGTVWYLTRISSYETHHGPELRGPSRKSGAARLQITATDPRAALAGSRRSIPMASADDDQVPNELRSSVRRVTSELQVLALTEARRCIRDNPAELPAVLAYRWRVVLDHRTATILDPELVQTKLGAPPSKSFLDCLQAVLPRQKTISLSEPTLHYETVAEVPVPTKFTNDDQSGIRLLLKELREGEQSSNAP